MTRRPLPGSANERRILHERYSTWDKLLPDLDSESVLGYCFIEEYAALLVQYPTQVIEQKSERHTFQ